MSLYSAAVAESNLFNDGPATEQECHRTKSLELISTIVEGEILGEQGFKHAGHCERLNAPPELLWRVLAVWERAAPQDKRLQLYRAKMLLQFGAIEPALKLAHAAIHEKVDPAWRKLLNDVEKQLKQQFQNLQQIQGKQPSE